MIVIMIVIMTVAPRTIAAVNQNTAAVRTANDLKACMDMQVRRRQTSIPAASAAIATGFQWVAVTNIGTAAKIVANMTEAARNIGEAAGKTNTTSAAVMATRSAAPVLNAVTTNHGTTTRNDTTIRAAIVRDKITANAIMTTTAIASAIAATKDAAGGIAHRMKSHRGLATKKRIAGAAWTNSGNIADADRKVIAVLMNALKKTSTID